MTLLYCSWDSSSRSVGTAEVIEAIQREAIRRGTPPPDTRLTGAHGLYWLEPLIEVETPAGRVAYGPVSVDDVPSLFDAEFLTGGAHRLRQGVTEEIPFLGRQTRITFQRCGVVPLFSIQEFEAHGGFAGLRKALAMAPAEIVDAVTASGLRGRGGAGFPTGIKWKTVLEEPAGQKYIVANADEGDSGTYADRMLMEGDPFSIIEGMTIAGLAVGATEGYIYIRSEYPDAFEMMNSAIQTVREEGYLGESVLGSGKSFEMHTRLGAGAYICGEETALLESLEGKKGVIRPRPPLPAVQGLFGRPTVVNNVLTLATVPMILAEGPERYASLGMGRSRGTAVVQLAGNIARAGLVEVPYGITLRELIYDFGGGTASGRPLRAVMCGGPLGAYFPEELLDTPIDYESFAAAGGLLGHGGIVVFDDTVDLAKQARFAMEFCAIESCGKCTPCRIGSTRGVEVIDRIIEGSERTMNLELLDDLLEVMKDGSLCGLGGLTPYPVGSALRYFPEDFDKPARPPQEATP